MVAPITPMVAPTPTATMPLIALLCWSCLALAAADSPPPSLGVLGLGSNVVDRFYRVRGADGLG